ncbi:MAG: translation initiation factor IF-3 [Bacilli bacterium]|nr:translation initiation factor IF-3 [Bacilli bacterium]MBN2877374.1 translation initiation factor IF-3 [Bacilli bacterium]
MNVCGYPNNGIHFFITLEVFNILYNNEKPVKRDNTFVNENVRFREVRLIGQDGQQFGVMSSREAYRVAQDEGFDLVCVAPQAKPPVCKLLDYSKYRYEQQRKAKEAKKHQKTVELKEIRMTAVIEKHDFETKLRNGNKFLSKGNKLKVSIRLPYRYVPTLIEQGKTVLQQFAEGCSEFGEIEGKITHEGRYISMTLGPNKN